MYRKKTATDRDEIKPYELMRICKKLIQKTDHCLLAVCHGFNLSISTCFLYLVVFPPQPFFYPQSLQVSGTTPYPVTILLLLLPPSSSSSSSISSSFTSPYHYVKIDSSSAQFSYFLLFLLLLFAASHPSHFRQYA